MMPFLLLFSWLLALIGLGAGVYFAWKNRTIRGTLEKQERDVNRRVYELAILKELGDRIGYSLDVREIVDIITDSLHQLIDYAAVSYMLLEPEKVIFKIHLEQSVHRHFVDDVRKRMLGSLSALLSKEIDPKSVEERLSGAMLIEEVDEPVRSFFNIPLVIGENVVGVLTVADTKAGLYKEEEMTILYKIVGQASKAVTSLQNVVQTEQEKVNAMMESIEDGVLMTDTDYRILVANPAAKRIIGKEDATEVSIFDFIDTLGNAIDIRGRLEESVRLGKVFASERFPLADAFYQAFVFPVKLRSGLGKGKTLGGVVIFHDVTHEVELERVREDFTSMIVHELRSPLSGIEKMSELLKMPGRKSSKTTHEYVDLIYQNASSMLSLVNDILDAAKLQAGKFEVHRAPTDIKKVVDDRVTFYTVSAKDKGLTLSAAYGADLPVDASFDEQRIKQVLNNFLSNALKFTGENGSVTIGAFRHTAHADVNVEAKEAGLALPKALPQESFASLPDSLVVAVVDTGRGIKEADQGKLFTRFKELYTPDHATDGTGLGLAIARGILEGHGGIIGLTSRVDVGSAFYFALPLETPPEHTT